MGEEENKANVTGTMKFLGVNDRILKMVSYNHQKKVVSLSIHLGKLTWDPKMKIWKIIFLLH